MRKNCNIIKDLIPIYVEDLTSEDSDQFIKEHLHSCEDCRNHLANVERDLPKKDSLDVDVHEDDQELIKGIKRRINVMRLIAILIGVVLGVGISLIFFNMLLVGFVSFLIFIGFLMYFINKNVKGDKK